MEDLGIIPKDPVIRADRKEVDGLGTIMKNPATEDSTAKGPAAKDLAVAEDLNILPEDLVLETISMTLIDLTPEVSDTTLKDQAVKAD